MIAVVFTEGATSPGIQERSELITDSGYLMPGRLPTLAMSGIWTAAIFLLGGLRRHGAPLILDRDMRHGVDELPQEVDLRTLHQARHHDGEADAHGHAGHAHEGLPHPGADMGPCDVEKEFHGGYRLL